MSRRFPAPWREEKFSGGYVVRDATGHRSYSESENAQQWTPRHHETFEPVTLAHIRGHGCRDLLVYCESVWCNHSALINADSGCRTRPQ
jgi:hypothetical protein